MPHFRNLAFPCDPRREWREIRYTLNRAANRKFCVVDAGNLGPDADNYRMALRFRPSQLSFRVRRNFKSRDWTSIGLRAARTFRRASTRPKLGSSGSGPSHMHTDESRVVGFAAPASNPSVDSNASPRRDWRGLIWTALIVIAIAAAAAIRVMQ
jgi:hypothetical protein